MSWTWWMTVLVILAVLVLIGCIPVGVDAAYGEGGVLLSAKISFFRLQILPANPKKPKKPTKAQNSRSQPHRQHRPQRRTLRRQKQPRKRSSPFPAACVASCAL